MILEHHSDSANPLDLAALRLHHGPLSDKPDGLWVSVPGPHDWPSFCRREGLHLGPHRHLVAIADDANLLRLETLDDVLGLHRSFPGHDLLAEMLGSVPGGLLCCLESFSIDWAAIAERWDGILIPTYQHAARRSDRARWYHSWDCASGCIWNARAIVSTMLDPQ